MTRLRNHFSIENFEQQAFEFDSVVCFFGKFHQSPFTYYALSINEDNVCSWYLYAAKEDNHSVAEQANQVEVDYVLGVFDTVGQLEFFLNLHTENELKVPALKILEDKEVSISEGEIRYPRYEGVYRVGFKSYNVVTIDSSKAWKAEFINSYKIELLGEYTEKDCCIAVYSHFDQRLRSCRMC